MTTTTSAANRILNITYDSTGYPGPIDNLRLEFHTVSKNPSKYNNRDRYTRQYYPLQDGTIKFPENTSQVLFSAVEERPPSPLLGKSFRPASRAFEVPEGISNYEITLDFSDNSYKGPQVLITRVTTKE